MSPEQKNNIFAESEPTILADAASELSYVIRWVLSGLIQATFIICWVLIQWGVNKYIITPFNVYGVDGLVLKTAQWIFAIATLAPIVFFLVQLLVTMYVRTRNRIREELKK